ncbi:MAG: glycine cleavage system protein H [Fidelibacterota bacterium]|nr:MAG: glycine cleavage system protein H [Candidatus Neomarinimicrobiota bacterium]
MTVILVVATFVIIIGVSLIIQRIRAPEREKVPTSCEVKAGITHTDFRLPKDAYFHPGHTWAMLQSSDFVWVGMDDFIQNLVDPISEVVPPDVGTEVVQGDPLASIKVDSMELSVAAPVSGKILGVNQKIMSSLPALKTDAITKQWIVNLKPTNLEKDLARLSVTGKAKEWLSREIERLKEFLETQALRPQLVGLTLQDGGEPVHGVLHSLDAEGLRQFEQEFLRNK